MTSTHKITSHHWLSLWTFRARTTGSRWKSWKVVGGGNAEATNGWHIKPANVWSVDNTTISIWMSARCTTAHTSRPPIFAHFFHQVLKLMSVECVRVCCLCLWRGHNPQDEGGVNKQKGGVRKMRKRWKLWADRDASWLPLLLKTVRHDSRSRFVRPRHSVIRSVTHCLIPSFIHSVSPSRQPNSQWNEQKKCKNAQTTIRFHGWFNRVWVWVLVWVWAGNAPTEAKTQVKSRNWAPNWDGKQIERAMGWNSSQRRTDKQVKGLNLLRYKRKYPLNYMVLKS